MTILTIVFLAIDICSKLVVSNLLEIGDSVLVIEKFFKITYVRNTGAAWSLLADKSYLVLILSAIIIVGIILYVYKNKSNNWIEKIGYSLITGGAIGNFTDRILYGYVIDFFDFTIFGYDAPIFNMADIFIVMGVILIIFYTWRCNNRGDKSM